MKNLKKATALVLTASMMFSVIAMTGCSKNKKGNAPTVDEDAPWFTASQVQFGDEYADMDLEYFYCEIEGVYNDGIVLSVDGSYPIPEDFDWERDSYSDYQIRKLDYYSMDGEVISSIDLMNAVDMEESYIEDISVTSEGVKMTVVDYSGFDYETFTAEIDIENGTIGDLVPVTESSFVPTDDMSNEGMWSIGDYNIERYWMYGQENFYSYTFTITDADGELTVVDLSEEFPNDSIFDISNYIQLTEDTILLLCSTDDTTKYVEMNITTGEVEMLDEDEFDWLGSIDLYSLTSLGEQGTYTTNVEGVKLLNFETETVEDVLSFNDCNINRYDISNLRLISASDDEYVFAGTVWTYDAIDFSSGNNDLPMIITLTKAETNPNAGKVIVTASSIGESYMTYPMSEAIVEFNETSEEYFVVVENKYSFDDYIDYNNLETTEEYMTAYYNGTADMSNQLAIDMLAGDGPDIILNAASFGQLLSDDYLVDLTDYISGSNGIDTNDYFSNVIDSSKTGDQLFFMPIIFSVSGISTDKSNVSSGQTGFTFDEYVDFVDEVCNGSDPMNSAKVDAFTDLYSNATDLFIDGTTVNFDNDDFRSLAEYVKDNVNYIEPTYDEWYWEEDMEPAAAQTAYLNGFASFISSYGDDVSRTVLLGLPSPDGRGPAINVGSSVAISASSASAVQDGAWEFTKFLLSDDIQELFVRDGNNPMSLATFDSTSAEAIESYNDSLSSGNNYSYSGWGMMASEPVDEEVSETYKDMLLSAYGVATADTSVLAVIREEMPAYFEGQKSLDDVIDILQDRVQTIVNERG